MSKASVILRIENGSFEEGFPISLSVYLEDRPVYDRRNCTNTPRAPEFQQLYESFLTPYRTMGGMAVITPVDGHVTHESRAQDCQAALQRLKAYTKRWFEDQSFKFLRAEITSHLVSVKKESIPIIIDTCTNDPQNSILLRKLPWHLWNLFVSFPHAEPVLSLRTGDAVCNQLTQFAKVLAIFGDDTGLTIERDLENLRFLLDEDSTIIFPKSLPASSGELKEELQDRLRYSRCEILFFAGHSNSNSDCTEGFLQISNRVTVQLETIEQALRVAVHNGLKLAIFNSCDGLGIATRLASVGAHAPVVIVMKEPVPDIVARKFLYFFLKEFSQGIPLYRAVREAREQLECLEEGALLDDQPPCPAATWLPVVCQDPNQPELIWNRKLGFWTKAISTLSSVQTRIISVARQNKWVAFSGIVAMVALLIIFLQSRLDIFQPVPVKEYGSSVLEANYSSLGEDILINKELWRGDQRPVYRDGCIPEFYLKEDAAGKFNDKVTEARKELESFLEKCPVDPEARIYWNNAKAIEDLASEQNIQINDTLQASNQLVKDGRLVRVAVVVPIDNGERTAGIAQEILRGVAQAQHEINSKQGIAGKLIQVQVINDTFRENQLSGLTEEIASALNSDPAITAVLGHYTSDATQKAGKEYERSGLVLISPTSTAVRSEEASISDNVFRVAPTDKKAAQDLAKYVDSKIKKAAILYEEGSIYSKSLKRAIENEMKGIEYVPCDLTSQSCLEILEDDEIKALFLLPSNQVKESDPIYKIIKENKGGRSIFAGDALYGGVTLGEIIRGDDLASFNRMKVAVPWHIEIEAQKKAAQSFLSQSTELWDLDSSSINWRTALSYDAVKAVEQALRDMGDKPQRRKLKSALLKVEADGFMGPKTIQFDSSSDRDLQAAPNLGTVIEMTCSSTCSFRAP